MFKFLFVILNLFSFSALAETPPELILEIRNFFKPALALDAGIEIRDDAEMPRDHISTEAAQVYNMIKSCELNVDKKEESTVRTTIGGSNCPIEYNKIDISLMSETDLNGVIHSHAQVFDEKLKQLTGIKEMDMVIEYKLKGIFQKENEKREQNSTVTGRMKLVPVVGKPVLFLSESVGTKTDSEITNVTTTAFELNNKPYIIIEKVNNDVRTCTLNGVEYSCALIDYAFGDRD